jgi:hypothetical protein
MANYNYYHSNQPRKKKDQESAESKVVFGLLKGLLFLVALPFGGKKKAAPAPKPATGTVDTQEVAKRWSDIQTSIGLGGVTHFGSAVVAADKLLDYVLRQKGYAGETMGERLRNAQVDMPSDVYHRAWQAHKLRNQLVHEVESEVLSYQAKEAILDYEQVLRHLGGLR